MSQMESQIDKTRYPNDGKAAVTNEEDLNEKTRENDEKNDNNDEPEQQSRIEDNEEKVSIDDREDVTAMIRRQAIRLKTNRIQEFHDEKLD